MLKVLHGADFHLDSPFSGLKPDAAARRRGEQRELLARLTDLAREREADLVLLSGDLLDGDLVFRETVQALARALGEIPCPVFLAPGNHDYYHINSLYAALDWPENVHIFREPRMTALELPELEESEPELEESELEVELELLELEELEELTEPLLSTMDSLDS